MSYNIFIVKNSWKLRQKLEICLSGKGNRLSLSGDGCVLQEFLKRMENRIMKKSLKVMFVSLLVYSQLVLVGGIVVNAYDTGTGNYEAPSPRDIGGADRDSN